VKTLATRYIVEPEKRTQVVTATNARMKVIYALVRVKDTDSLKVLTASPPPRIATKRRAYKAMDLQ